jgi:hypothetical protein
VVGTLYGYDPLSGGWGYYLDSPYIYNEFCYDLSFGIAKVADLILTDS